MVEDLMSALSSPPVGISVLPSVVLAVPNRTALAARLLHDIPGGLFIPGPSSLPAGLRVSVDIAVARELVSLQGTGVVRWRRLAPGPHLPTGLAVQLDDPSFVALLEGLARASPVRLVPRARRFVVSMDAVCCCGYRLVIGKTRDVSRNGLFIKTSEPFPMHSTVQVRLAPSGIRPFEVTAQVARTERGGMGLQLRPLDIVADYGWQQLQRALQLRALTP
jgi:hypothetical protein